jgi:hypothetical protein
VIYDMEIDLIRQQTDPEIKRQLSMGLMQWQRGMVYSNERLVQEQTFIGWNGILEGCLGNHWIIQQGQYYSKHMIKKGKKDGQD